MTPEILDKVKEFYAPAGEERVGLVLASGEVIELVNISTEPLTSFMLSPDDLLKHVILGKAQATWHTHPGGGNNLSTHDYQAFLNYPEMKHLIAGHDGVRIYEVENGRILQS